MVDAARNIPKMEGVEENTFMIKPINTIDIKRKANHVTVVLWS